MLVDFVGRVRSVARGADRLFRYGGEEFALLLSDADLAGALALARRIVEAVAREPLRSGHDAAVVTCSVGVAELGASDDTLGAELVGRSDAALYAAKRAGRNRAIAFARPRTARASRPPRTRCRREACRAMLSTGTSAPRPSELPEAVPASSPPATRGRVLVVEDDRALLEAYADILVNEGFVVSAVVRQRGRPSVPSRPAPTTWC